MKQIKDSDLQALKQRWQKLKDRQEFEKGSSMARGVPPVCTVYWTEKDWTNWFESRKPLKPFDDWLKDQI